MKRLLILTALLLLPTTAQAITWKEFFDAIKEHKYDHLFPLNGISCKRKRKHQLLQRILGGILTDFYWVSMR